MCYGPEFISKALDRWAYENGVTLDFSRPGKPTDNAFVKSFNSRLRDEYLNAHWFLSLVDARAKIEAWRRDYTESHPYTAWLADAGRICCFRGKDRRRINAGTHLQVG
jgi:putative transposase